MEIKNILFIFSKFLTNTSKTDNFTQSNSDSSLSTIINFKP